MGHPVLRRAAVPYDGQIDDAVLHALLVLMRHVMHAAPGVGLAAPQLAIPLRIAVLEDRYEVAADVAQTRERLPLDLLAVINPNYRPIGGETAAFYEGCLSFTGYQAVVERPRQIELSYHCADGTPVVRRLSGWQARIAQHETDHLDGTIYIDKALTRSLCSNEEYSRRWAQPDIEEARSGLGF
ncbi:peptide deformylase [Arthrobacter crystallopoietes BAB-32]|uniref:Peptide deformylase n=1 Tax=Arthrobacter crystallopoietes BAB-32 TaxID=1246476 RepID=N1V6E3_9MICC|nr:peptide deformylase [Arthrobacter crystallopoietes BAB-32]